MRGERAGSLRHPIRHQPGCNTEGRLAGGQRNSRDCLEVSEKAPGMAKSCRAGEEFGKRKAQKKQVTRHTASLPEPSGDSKQQQSTDPSSCSKKTRPPGLNSETPKPSTHSKL